MKLINSNKVRVFWPLKFAEPNLDVDFSEIERIWHEEVLESFDVRDIKVFTDPKL